MYNTENNVNGRMRRGHAISTYAYLGHLCLSIVFFLSVQFTKCTGLYERAIFLLDGLKTMFTEDKCLI